MRSRRWPGPTSHPHYLVDDNRFNSPLPSRPGLNVLSRFNATSNPRSGNQPSLASPPDLALVFSGSLSSDLAAASRLRDLHVACNCQAR